MVEYFVFKMSPGIAHLKEHKFFTMFVMVQNVKRNQTEEHKRTRVLQLRVALIKFNSICLQMADPPNKILCIKYSKPNNLYLYVNILMLFLFTWKWTENIEVQIFEGLLSIIKQRRVYECVQ